MSPLKIAHRGNTKGFVENTLVAFKNAIDQGLDGFEFDIQLTLDAEPVVFHDDTLWRFFKSDLKISEILWKDLKELRFFDSSTIPHLDQLLELDLKAFHYLEAKVPDHKYFDESYLQIFIEILIDRISQFKLSASKDLTIGSFHFELLNLLEPHCSLPLTAIVEKSNPQDINELIRYNYQSLEVGLPITDPAKTMIWGMDITEHKSLKDESVFALVSDHWL